MAASLLSTAQAAWALHLLLAVFSAVAIASCAPAAAGGSEMYAGSPGDIRGVVVVLGSSGLIGVAILRIAYITLPKTWRLYLDRIEFSLIAMLWICWTSATMAFSAFTLEQGVCSPTLPEVLFPTCPLLTFDLSLLHLLSLCTFALLLVILSNALSPGYYASLLEDEEVAEAAGVGKTTGGQGFVMWELAVGSETGSPILGPSRAEDRPNTASTSVSYGTLSPTTALRNPYAPEHAEAQDTSDPLFPAPTKRDKFPEGRLWTYLPMALCSIGVAFAGVVALNVGVMSSSVVFVLVIAILSLIFSAVCIKAHFSRDQKPLDGDSFISRRQMRAIEVAAASTFFILWPLAAIIYTLHPSTPYLPCSNPASSAVPSPREDADLEESAALCTASVVVVTLAWAAGWIGLKRIMGLVFPLADIKPSVVGDAEGARGAGEEAVSLLSKKRTQSNENEIRRPQVGWGRIVAGEAFELGEDEDCEVIQL
ncbi:hypothetical protein L198_00350 [Cryptococcus wingfieldii CBS 7118]|uniref:MARVEL domain-containing protein n=1 Tax=Cryptococcus wingfieldii CBS 7118 TaxID=1295528 RepID=A0A1E3K618_9TREE|nr:hypothetical protein L198_00350 [Cryptococcus wingfieldii CBS 7118]ODO08618.1 hypothetical protein L198_00350 [Cryptococcus wingfieldii CBS 7118]